MVSRLRASVVCRQDGLDIDCVQNALIEENYFDVDDDALCVKSGRDWDGRQFGRPARDILFRNNVRDSDGINRGKTACESGKHRLLQVIGRGHGITIGSETSGSVYNGNSRPSLRPAVRGRAMPGAISLLDLPLRNRSPRLCQLLLVTVRELLKEAATCMSEQSRSTISRWRTPARASG